MAAFTLDEYQKRNNIALDLIKALKSIVSAHMSILILNGAPMNIKPFLNALVSAIPKQQRFYTIAEDLNTLPAICTRREVKIVDSLKDNYEEILKACTQLVGFYDKLLLFIDNYTLDLKVIQNNLKLLGSNARCLISTFHRDVQYFNDIDSYEGLCLRLKNSTNIDFSMFDCFILVDNYFVNEKKQDVLRIICK